MATTVNRSETRTNIRGWGVDADKKNRPAVPKEKTPPNGTGAHWVKAPEQEMSVEILKSIERPERTPLFGSPNPPRGLSGVIRKFAFKYSEGRTSHWMLLLFADRIDMVEGVIEDLARGHIPNVFAERGWGAAWKYNKKTMQKKALVAGALVIGTGLAIYAMTKKKRNR